MEQFTKEDFERLAAIKNEYCVSIYIPTHQAGINVNEGIDQINFKNQIQKIQQELENRNYRNISTFINRAYELLDDNSFWKEQSAGLAVFFNDTLFEVFRVPVSFEALAILSRRFMLTPVLPLLLEDDEFYTLAISQNRIRLFHNTTYSYKEEDITELVPFNADEIFSQYDFGKDIQGENMDLGGLRGRALRSSIISHGYNPKDDEDKYIFEFLRQVNNGVLQVIKNKKSPLIVVAVEYIATIYKSANTYNYLADEAVIGNPDRVNESELHERAYNLIKQKLNAPRKKDIERYGAWAGTGKTSYDLNVILSAAFDGRIESLFIEEGKHVWGKYDPEKRSATLHSTKDADDSCLYTLAAAKTIENNGKAYIVKADEMPEKTVVTSIAAIFRY